MDNERLKRQLEFLLEIDKEKKVGRQTYITGAERKENDAEHAWHMAVMTILLAEYANEPIDVLKTVSMILVHDLVEIDAGDTYAYDDEAKKTQSEREKKAAERIFPMLPEDQAEKIAALFREFEECETKEAKFARVMDNLQPLMLNHATEGKAWRERGVPASKVMARNSRNGEGSEILRDYIIEEIIGPAVDAGWLKDDVPMPGKCGR